MEIHGRLTCFLVHFDLGKELIAHLELENGEEYLYTGTAWIDDLSFAAPSLVYC